MTIAKLEIFEDYAQEWIPTFVMSSTPNPSICIFDFFAGPGHDPEGTAGSPIRLLDKIKEQIGHIFQKKVKVTVYFNEYDKGKHERLKLACEKYLTENPEVGRAVTIRFSSKNFDESFSEMLPVIKKQPSLVYLDQNGIRFLSEKYLLELEKLDKTDIIYFASASHLWRFGESEEFQNHLQIDMDEVRKHPRQFVHRSLIRELKKKLPAQTRLRLYPFSLKKGPNIHGIIFCATHPRAFDKFLTVAWKRNETNGEANFDIDEEGKIAQLSFFEPQKLKKIPAFQLRVREKVLDGSIKGNFDAYTFALEEGHIGSHAADEIRKMKSEKLIDYEGAFPLVNYQNVYQKQTFLNYKRLKK